MTPQFAIHAAWASMVGLVVGAIGLWMAFWAWLNAKGAKEAAREAAGAVQAQTATEQLRTLLTQVEQMEAALEATEAVASRGLAGQV